MCSSADFALKNNAIFKSAFTSSITNYYGKPTHPHFSSSHPNLANILVYLARALRNHAEQWLTPG